MKTRTVLLIAIGALVIDLGAGLYVTRSVADTLVWALASIIITLAVAVIGFLLVRWYLQVFGDKMHLNRVRGGSPTAEKPKEAKAAPEKAPEQPAKVTKTDEKKSSGKTGAIVVLLLLGVFLYWSENKWHWMEPIVEPIVGLLGVHAPSSSVTTTTVSQGDTQRTTVPVVCTEESQGYTVTKTDAVWIHNPEGCQLEIGMKIAEIQSTFLPLSCKDPHGNKHDWAEGMDCRYVGLQLKPDALDETRDITAVYTQATQN